MTKETLPNLPSKSRLVDSAYQRWSESPTEENQTAFYRQLLYDAEAIAVTLLGERDADLVADIASGAMLKAGQFRGNSKFSTWFFRLARNRCIDFLRARQRQRNLIASETAVELENFAGAVEAPDARILLQTLLGLLSEAEQDLLVGKLHNEDEESMAAKLGIPREGVKRRWFRLKAKLRTMLET